MSVKPVIGPAATSLVTPTAGKTLTIAMPVTRSDTGGKLVDGATLTLDPTIGSTLVAHSEQLKNGTASVRLTVPPTAKGKRLTVKVTIKLGSQTATRLTTIPIK
jgi:hypothetical protein